MSPTIQHTSAKVGQRQTFGSGEARKSEQWIGRGLERPRIGAAEERSGWAAECQSFRASELAGIAGRWRVEVLEQQTES